MKAFQLLAHGAPGKFEVRDIPDPQPGADDAVVRVRACGLNRLDLWLEEAGLPVPLQLPRTPGGEAAGEILSVGSNVKDWKPGDRVAVQSNIFCGQCEYCRQGNQSICLNSQLLGVQRDGGFAEQLLVPARVLARLPDNVSFETSAALTLAGSTAMHMLVRRGGVKAGDWVLAIGASSGVGSNAIQIAKGMGAHVITTGSTPAKRELGLKLGADFAVDSTLKDWAAEVRKITNKRGVDLVIEHVGGDVLLQCFNCLGRAGSIVTCGATAGREVPIKLWGMFVREQRLIGSYGRSRADLLDILDWAAQGKIKPAIDQTFSLNEAAEAFATLRQRKVMGKVVIKP
jgi:NADPH:quinone reductase-like Zn-dependent oxidoreductase